LFFLKDEGTDVRRFSRKYICIMIRVTWKQ